MPVLKVWNGTEFVEVGGAGGGGGGDVVGPSSSTDNAVARYDGTTGKRIQNSGVLIDDSDSVTGIVNLNGKIADDLVTGPNTATDNAIARFDGTTGKVIQDSGVTLGDAGTSVTFTSLSGILAFLGANDKGITIAGGVGIAAAGGDVTATGGSSVAGDGGDVSLRAGDALAGGDLAPGVRARKFIGTRAPTKKIKQVQALSCCCLRRLPDLLLPRSQGPRRRRSRRARAASGPRRGSASPRTGR